VTSEILEGDRYILKTLDGKRSYKYSHDRLNKMLVAFLLNWTFAVRLRAVAMAMRVPRPQRRIILTTALDRVSLRVPSGAIQ
jgi:hypothetical protein